MSVAEKLDKIGNNFFLSAFLTGKGAIIPIALVSLIFSLISLVLYGIGYGIWFLANIGHHKNCQQKTCVSESFHYFKKHIKNYLFSSSLGFIAVGLSIAALFVPVIAIPATLLFLISNLGWTYGEYNRLKHMEKSEADQTNYQAQRHYFHYAIISTFISVISAISAILCVAFPPMAPIISTAAVVIGLVISCYALIKWADSKLTTLKKQNKESRVQQYDGSYRYLSDKLSLHQQQAHQNENTDKPKKTEVQSKTIKLFEKKTAPKPLALNTRAPNRPIIAI